MALSYNEQGGPSEFAVVFVHGPTDSWRSYEAVLGLVDASVRCIAVSQRGHGDSDKPEAGYDVRTFAADLIAFLDERRITRAVLVGHSGSCPVVRRVAIDRPELVAGLVLEASPTTLANHPGLVELLGVVRELDDPVDPEFVRAFVSDTSLPDLDLELFVAEARKVPARAWRGMFEDLRTYDDTDELARITAPVLLVWGDADPLIDRATQDDLLRRLPNAELVVLAGVGHTPRWEQPAAFAGYVDGFVSGRATTP